ncbi:MAG: lipid-A-disaccharide synthase [Piscirickettsiaceae bacterium]|nr:lipid-A-disaccharide synthase [Piscirickettsiaceae bacterium]
MEKKIIVVTGEASGEIHAGRMLSELRSIAPKFQVSGIGGNTMQDAGVNIKVNFSQLSIMGMVEIIKNYRQIKNIFNKLLTYIECERPDLLVLVDYPGFNLKLARAVKRMNIPIMYYISPKIWAWHKSRIKKIKLYVDHMAVLFPFEQPIYEKAGISVACVGHPLVGAAITKLNFLQAKQKFNLNLKHRIIGLFPGSRNHEVKTLLPIMIKAVEQLHNHHCDISVVLPLAPGIAINIIMIFIEKTAIPIKIVKGHFYDLIKSCDAIVAVSGTVTLEIALLGIPHILIYRAESMTYLILKRLVNIPYIGLCNIISCKSLVLELLQHDVTSNRLHWEISNLMIPSRSDVKAKKIKQKVLTALGPSGGANHAAHQIIEMLKKGS